MCGFAGLVHKDPSYPIQPLRLERMRDSIVHRGPDDAGSYIGAGVGLGSRRLAIQDLSERGHMPMSTPDGRYHIVYNGEVYNFQELRRLLEKKGFVFRSSTDTEVLLYLFVLEGPAMLPRLNGMFAFAIWDATERTLFIARDRLGVKPLYYAFDQDLFYFGSEEKTLFNAGYRAEFNPDCLEELLCFRYVAGERTPFRGVKRLLPGHHLTWRDGQIQIQRWWNLSERIQHQRAARIEAPAKWFRESFDSSIALRRISDVPIGVLLSGGLDSSSVAAALALQAGSGVQSFTMRFREGHYDEGPLAQTVAERYKLQAHELTLGSEELLARLREASWLNDEPLAHASDIHVGAISRYAKSRVTVLLSGEGADETLGGYVRYQPLRHPNLLRLLQPAAGLVGLLPQDRLRKLARFLKLGPIDRFILFNACNVLPPDLEAVGLRPTQKFSFREAALREAQAAFPNEPFRQAMYSDQHTFLCSLLDRNDRMTMGASIECRVPFLDYRLVETLGAMPSEKLLQGREPKQLLRSALGERLPPQILSGRKWGFGVPWARYFREIPELRERVQTLARQSYITETPLDPRRVQQLTDGFLAGAPHDALITQLVMLGIWHEEYFPKARSTP